MYCQQCGHSVQDKDAFCQRCGSRVKGKNADTLKPFVKKHRQILICGGISALLACACILGTSGKQEAVALNTLGELPFESFSSLPEFDALIDSFSSAESQAPDAPLESSSTESALVRAESSELVTSAISDEPSTVQDSEEEVYWTYYVGIDLEGGVSIRETRKENSALIGAIPRNGCIYITKKIGDFGYGEYAGCTGWVDLSYLSPVLPSGDLSPKINQEYIVWLSESETLNLRAKPDQESKVIGSIPHGESLFVTSFDVGWAEVSYNGKNGWVSMFYLTQTPYE